MGDDFGAAIALSDGEAEDMLPVQSPCKDHFWIWPVEHVRHNSIVRMSKGKDSEQDRIAVYYGYEVAKPASSLCFLFRSGERKVQQDGNGLLGERIAVSGDLQVYVDVGVCFGQPAENLF